MVAAHGCDGAGMATYDLPQSTGIPSPHARLMVTHFCFVAYDQVEPCCHPQSALSGVRRYPA